jgi:hypothetical protein
MGWKILLESFAQSVNDLLKRHGLTPAPEREKTLAWQEFIRSH